VSLIRNHGPNQDLIRKLRAIWREYRGGGSHPYDLCQEVKMLCGDNA
jgi:hypothetical protein